MAAQHLMMTLNMSLNQRDTLKELQPRKSMCHTPSIPVPWCLIDSFASTPIFWKLNAPNSNREFYGRSWKLGRGFNYPNTRFTSVSDVCIRWSSCKILVQDVFLIVYSKENVKWHGIKLYTLCVMCSQSKMRPVRSHYLRDLASQFVCLCVLRTCTWRQIILKHVEH